MLLVNYLRISFFLSMLCFAACKQNNPQLQEQLVAIQSQLDLANVELKTLKSKSSDLLVHSVFFQLKPDLNDTQKGTFLKGLKSLSQISYPKNLFVGAPAETGDGRLKNDYDVVLQMNFSSLEDLAKYQNHEHHLKVKAEIGSALAAKPFVYDYWMK